MEWALMRDASGVHDLKEFPSTTRQKTKMSTLVYSAAAKFHALPVRRHNVEGLEYLEKVEVNAKSRGREHATMRSVSSGSEKTESVLGTTKPQQWKEAGDGMG
ncbi:hypothetical protein B0H19DRAFT_1083682 [Mycena capillaripes]|nr:hypothetical protein B0H19DRAFT_1083682 [Mycena capillaripes]